MPGETSFIRNEVLRYCAGRGIDIGCGGDKIVPDAIGFDLPVPYAAVGDDHIDLTGDARHIELPDACLDYVYSSHLLEDFPDVKPVLTEWLRLLKPGGYLILYLPDEQVFREHCRNTGQPANPHHRNEAMSLPFMLRCLSKFPVNIVHTLPRHQQYSFLVVARKSSQPVSAT